MELKQVLKSPEEILQLREESDDEQLFTDGSDKLQGLFDLKSKKAMNAKE